MASFRDIKSAVYDREERKQQYQGYIRGLNAYERHKKFVNDYVSYYGKGTPSTEKLPIKTDQDTLREGYRFIRTEEDDLDTSWEQRLVKRYYDKLFKEYCIADMSKYKSGKIGLRWRTEKEVVSGKGQFVCGNKHCDEKIDLSSYEVNFAYFEAGESKQALVKLVACSRCAEKLHYKRNKEKEKSEEREKAERAKKRRERSSSDEEPHDEDVKRSNRKMGASIKRAERSSSEDAANEHQVKRRKGKTRTDAKETDQDENFDEFLEGMFP